MKSQIFWTFVCLLVLLSLVWTSCAQQTTSSTTQTTSSTSQVTVTTQTTPPPSTTSTSPANWWDKLGTPQSGGTINYRITSLSATFDPWAASPGAQFLQYEDLFCFDWTVDRKLWPFNTNFAPIKYYMGILAESWEQTDPQTLILHLRQNAKWQNMPPVNGRELTSDDVQQHYDRILGTGSGYTQRHPLLAGWLSLLERVIATDKYTVTVKFNRPSAVALYQFFDQANENQIEPPEVAQLTAAAAPPSPEPGAAPPPGPPLPSSVDWKLAAGSGPWMIADYIAGSVLAFNKNPDYWGYDERHPQNRLPYADTLKALIVPDNATAQAALRTGKVDFMEAIKWEQADALTNTNPDLQMFAMPAAGAAIEYRVDNAPFTDIRVRQALEMSIDRKTIAETYYGGRVDGTPAGLISTQFTGYNFAYADWPQELKDAYSYNPTKARQLLADAGFPSGFKTNIATPTSADIQLLQILKAALLDIGVDMTINEMDPITYRSFVVAKKHDQMAFDAGQTATTRPPHNVIYYRYSKEKELNVANVSDPGYDALVAQFESATTEAELQKVTREADRYILEHHWALYTFPTISYSACQPYLKGYMGDAATGGGGVAYAMYFARWWIDQTQK